MKRIEQACLLQTLHFQLKEDMKHCLAVKAMEDEIRHYKLTLKQRGTHYQIADEVKQPDGSVIMHIKKQYNNYAYSEYMS